MQTDLAIGNQVHIPLHRSQKWQKHSARLPSRLQRDFKAPTLRARPQSLPKRAHPARQAHQPLGPGTASRPQAASAGNGSHPGGVDAGFPAVPAPRRFPRHPSGIGPHDYWPFKAEAARLVAGVLGSACLMLSQSQRPTHRLNRHSHLTVAHPPSQQPPGRHPCQAHTLSVLTLHVVGKAHFYQPVGPKVPGG